MSTALQTNAVMELKGLLSKDKVQQIFFDMLGKRAGAFVNSVTNITRNSYALQKCDPQTIISSAIDAASLNLPVDPGLGFAAIVPYGTKAQFQIMYKGITQLAIRSGQYKTISCSEIYSDELLSHNPITGVVKFKDPAGYKLRFKKQDKDVIGHYAEFVLKSGFEKSDYMSHAEAMAHGEKYSKAYQNDLRKKEKNCPWSLMPIAMCNKTVYLRLMKKYGILSIEMQDAFERDESFEAAQEAAEEQIKAEQGSKIVDAEFEKPEESTPTTPEQLEKLKCPKCKLPYRRKGMRRATQCCVCTVAVDPTTGEVKEPQLDDQGNPSRVNHKGVKARQPFKWSCKDCGLKFDEPKILGVGESAKQCCPNLGCLSVNIEEAPF